MYAFRDLLDKQLVDKHGCRIGRVDGIVGEVRDDGPPVIRSLEVGMATIAKRVFPSLGRLVERISRKLAVRRTPWYRIEWNKVKSVDRHHVSVMTDSEAEPSNDWEWWLRRHVVEKIPGSKPEEEEK